MNTNEIQLKLLDKAKKYLEKKSNDKVNVSSSAHCFLCAWDINPGYARLKLWQEGSKKYFSAFKIFLKDIILISSSYNYQLLNVSKLKEKYSKVVVTWGVKSGFFADGSYQDRYFKTNTRENKDVLWFLIYEEAHLPEKIDSNILILTPQKNKIKYNIFYLTKNITKKIFSLNFSLKNFHHRISSSTEFSSIVWNKLKNFISNDTKTIIMPYESQPFQNEIFKLSKKINNNIKTIGYVHAFPVGLPTNYIFRDGSPEQLILNSEDQYYCFEKFLNWEGKNLKILPSLRYSKDTKNMSGNIYLPLAFHSTDIIIKSLKKLLTNNNTKLISSLVIKNHPLKENSKKHLKVINEINNLFKENKKLLPMSKENNTDKLSIFIGYTSSPIEALERGVEVIHICDDPVFQSYNEIFWPNIKIKKIDNNIYKYQLIKKGKLIQLGGSSKIFNEGYIN